MQNLLHIRRQIPHMCTKLCEEHMHVYSCVTLCHKYYPLSAFVFMHIKQAKKEKRQDWTLWSTDTQYCLISQLVVKYDYFTTATSNNTYILVVILLYILTYQQQQQQQQQQQWYTALLLGRLIYTRVTTYSSNTVTYLQQ